MPPEKGSGRAMTKTVTKALVGHTGFVGSNLADQTDFQGLYNSKNIESAYNTKPDLLIYSGVRAEKYLANREPERDYSLVQSAFENIQKIAPKKVVLMSTIDVYKTPISVDENTPIDTENLHPYGLNRYLLEKMVEESDMPSLILRLPALFGKNIKKNFIYDLINIIPAMLQKEKLDELSETKPAIKQYYTLHESGLYKCTAQKSELPPLRQLFTDVGFTALNFTDSRASFQFFNLNYLWEIIDKALEFNLNKLNIATEPLAASEIYDFLYTKSFINEVNPQAPKYDFKSKHAELFGGKNGYMYSSSEVLNDIKHFVKTETETHENKTFNF